VFSSQDEWLGGMRKTITIEFYKDGELVGKSENLPGDKIKDAATKAKVTIGDEVSSEQGNGSMCRWMMDFRVPLAF